MFVLLGATIAAGAILTACGGAPSRSAPPTSAAGAATALPEIPFLAEWQTSAHAQADSAAFRYWDRQEPAEVPVSCAKCHTSGGYLSFLGADGSEAGKVNAATPASDAQGIFCIACHNPVTLTKTAVTFPSGVAIAAGDDARCMECHQGRESKVGVNAQIERFGASGSPDSVIAPIKDSQGNDIFFGFRTIHYDAAAATLYGGMAQGGYQYDGLTYNAKFNHAEGYDSCIGCHDSHTLEVKVEQCAVCHENVAAKGDLKNIRTIASMGDYDGDGNTTEGIYYEIEGLQDALYSEIQRYAIGTAGEAIVYDQLTFPHFFVDANANGMLDEGEALLENAYKNWTPRLFKAAYNYQVSLKDPGGYAHGGKYIVQLLYDSIADLGGDVSGKARNDAGHFAGNTLAFRYWDFDVNGQQPAYSVPGACAKCHSASGLPEFLREGANVSNPSSNGFACSTCHNPASFPALYIVNSVTFPSGAVISFGGKDPGGNFLADKNNVCLLCHQGRSSKATVDLALGNKPLDLADANIRLGNVHYFAAGATLFGSEAQGAYMYAGKEYAGMFRHASESGSLNRCSDCHAIHALKPKLESCQTCHSAPDPKDIRENNVDYDGDGDVTEGLKGEIDTLAAALYVEMQRYSAQKGSEIVYNPVRFPYFFNTDGQPYHAFTPRLLKAAFNYQYARNDSGAYAHNAKFVLQILIDSIEDLGGDTRGYTRP